MALVTPFCSDMTVDVNKLKELVRYHIDRKTDKILVLDAGKCVGMGTHKELLKNCKVYQEIAYSQLSKEELENG